MPETPVAFDNDRWLHARVADGYIYDGYIADLMTAWQVAHSEAKRQIQAVKHGNALANSVRFALIRTTDQFVGCQLRARVSGTSGDSQK